MRLARELGDLRLEARGLSCLGTLHEMQERGAEAGELFIQALESYKRCNDAYGQVEVTYKLASWHHTHSRLTEAKAGQRIVYFMDAAHFVFAPFLGYLWSFSRLFVRAPAGRKRFNVLGALNAITHEVITVTNDSYINAQSVCTLLRQLAALPVNVPLTLVLDNARYQKCAIVQE